MKGHIRRALDWRDRDRGRHRIAAGAGREGAGKGSIQRHAVHTLDRLGQGKRIGGRGGQGRAGCEGDDHIAKRNAKCPPPPASPPWVKVKFVGVTVVRSTGREKDTVTGVLRGMLINPIVGVMNRTSAARRPDRCSRSGPPQRLACSRSSRSRQ
jgi:hypothetical protein